MGVTGKFNILTLKNMLSFLRLSFLPASADLGLLVLRLISGGSILWLHGRGKLMGFNEMAEKFPTILINSKVSLGMATFAEVLCAGLLILGLFGRFAALALAITMGVAFWKAHNFVLSGPGSGELAFIYFAGFFTLFLTGPGRFSVDGNAGSSK